MMAKWSGEKEEHPSVVDFKGKTLRTTTGTGSLGCGEDTNCLLLVLKVASGCSKKPEV